MRKLATLIGIFALATVWAMAPNKVASPLLDKPAEIAKKEHKLMFVDFSASWCGHCKHMQKVLSTDGVKQIWEKYFTEVSVIVDEMGDKVNLDTPGGDELRSKLHGDKVGIPFFAFVDPEGNVLGDSYLHPGKDNMGCPESAEEIKTFMETLKKAVPSMTQADRDAIQKAFETVK